MLVRTRARAATIKIEIAARLLVRGVLASSWLRLRANSGVFRKRQSVRRAAELQIKDRLRLVRHIVKLEEQAMLLVCAR